jgi:ankyrin repeat protein
VCEIERGARCHACCCRFGDLCLHMALRRERPISTVELLISKNADVNAKDG